jgi:2-octaprenyl-6-methoxyphenol hydroxylase
LIGADGANSKVREYLGIGVTQTDYEQVAIIGNLVTEKPIMNRAYERFSESGPVALLPVQDNRTAFIWVVPKDQKKKLLELEDEAFISAIQEVFGSRLGEFKQVE